MLAEYDTFFPSEMVTDSIAISARGLRSLLGIFYSLESKKYLAAMLEEITVDVAHAGDP